MSDFLFLFLMILILIAAFLRADFVLTVIYLLLGAVFLGRIWSRQALVSVAVRRTGPMRLFHGEKAAVRVELKNTSLLPVVWLQLRESLPLELGSTIGTHRVISLGSKEKKVFDYYVIGTRRGYYPIGPLFLNSGICWEF